MSFLVLSAAYGAHGPGDGEHSLSPWRLCSKDGLRGLRGWSQLRRAAVSSQLSDGLPSCWPGPCQPAVPTALRQAVEKWSLITWGEGAGQPCTPEPDRGCWGCLLGLVLQSEGTGPLKSLAAAL